jgi:hypothetical protein
MPSSDDLAADNSDNCRPDASRMTRVPRRDFSLLTIEDKITYRKWRRAALVMYGAVAIIVAALSIANSPTNTSPKNEMFSALGPPVAHKSQR